MVNYVIYMIENLVNGKKYIGQTKDFEKRKKSHLRMRGETYLNKALKKYGKENFIFVVIENNISEDQINDKEKYYIKYFDTFNGGYNLTEGGDGGNTIKNPEIAKKHSENTTKGKLGKKRNIGSDHLEKMRLNIKKAQDVANAKKAKPIMIEGKCYPSQTIAAKELGILQATINYRLKHAAPGYKYL